MDRHRSDRQSSGAGDRIDGGDLPRRPPPSRWSDGGDATNDHHRFPRSNAGGFNGGFNGGGGFNTGGGGGGRFHPYHDGSRGGPGFRGGPDGGFGAKRGFVGRGGGDQDGNRFVKLFVGSVPRTVTEEEIRPLFEEHGNVIEVALIRGRGGQQQGFCFVKYATIEEAERAIAALHNQYTLPGASTLLQVRYADGDRERQEDKLFVASLNKRATEQEIAEIFTPYGHVEDVYLMRDELKQFRGCGFVRFSNREMAVAAMNALHGTYVMRGCDQPLIVRFADPKRPRPDPRGFPAVGGPGSGHRSETATVIGPTAKFDEPIGGRIPPNAWGTVSPQSRGPSSQAGGRDFGAVQGFGSNNSAKGGMMDPSAISSGIVGEAGGPQSNFAATSMQQGFNPSMPQIHPALAQQMPPLQKLPMAPQNFPPSLQPHPNPQIPSSHSEGQKPPIQQLGQLQIPQSTGLPSNQTLSAQPLPGLIGQLPSSQPIIQQNASGTPLQAPLGLSHQGIPSIANQQQLLQRPMQQMPSQLPQVLLQQQAQALQSSFQSSQQAIFQLQQQLQLMQQSGLSQQQVSQNAKQQAAWSGPQPNSSALATASTPAAVMPAAATSMPVNATSAAPLTCNWTEHTSPQGFKYYYNSVTQESKWEKPEEYSIFEQQQQQQQQKLLLIQQQQQKLAVQQLQSPAQAQSQTQTQPSQQIPQTQIQPNQQILQAQIVPNQQISQAQIQPIQQIPQAQQVQSQMQFRQQAQLQLLQPSLAYQASAMGNQPNIQNFNYAQLQAANSIPDTARIQQAIQTQQELTWQNKPSGS